MVPNIQNANLVQRGVPSGELSKAVANIKETSSTDNMRPLSRIYYRGQSWREVSILEPHFNIGLIIDSTNIRDPHVSAMNKPATRCQLTSLVVLNPNTNETTTDSMNDSVGKWLKANKISQSAESLDFIGTGQGAFDKMISSDSIHAVYVIVPTSSQKDYVLQALNAKKHVLANDPTSVKLSEFMEELECAKKNGKFIQTTAMFVHQYRVQRFMNHVLDDEKFGRITGVDSSIKLNYDDVEKVGVKLPLGKEEGCIRVLGRFCVLVSTMFFNRVGSYAESARVKSWKHDANGLVVSADCTVKFTNDRHLNFNVSYIHTVTRQSIELKATSRYATMNDFVIEHPDGLATYRVYDRKAHRDGNTHKFDCDSFDVGMGLGQERAMWRNFVRLSHNLEDNGGWNDNDAIAECRELTDVAIQMKKILLALMESLENDGKEFPVEGFEPSK